MQKLTFQRNKYGKEILIDTVHTSEFAVDKMEVLPDFYTNLQRVFFKLEKVGFQRIVQIQVDKKNPETIQLKTNAKFRKNRGYLHTRIL